MSSKDLAITKLRKGTGSLSPEDMRESGSPLRDSPGCTCSVGLSLMRKKLPLETGDGPVEGPVR